MALEALKAAGAANLSGKPVIDATNPIADAPPANGVLKFFTGLKQSLMERFQSAFPDAHFVKAFNSVGNARMIDPESRRQADHVHLRQRRQGQDDRRRYLRSIRLGDGRHGQGRSGARHRAAVHAVVHSRLHQERMDARL